MVVLLLVVVVDMVVDVVVRVIVTSVIVVLVRVVVVVVVFVFVVLPVVVWVVVRGGKVRDAEVVGVIERQRLVVAVHGWEFRHVHVVRISIHVHERVAQAGHDVVDDHVVIVCRHVACEARRPSPPSQAKPPPPPFLGAFDDSVAQPS